MITTHPFDDDKLKEECAIFGVFGHKDAAALTALGLHALQHRGQEATGIVTYDGDHFHSHRGLGHVADNFGNEAVIARLPGWLAIGHNRYATTGDTILRNVQPLFAEFDFGGFAVGHNGNLTNAHYLRRGLVKKGCLFQSTTDTEVIVHLMAMAEGDVTDRLVQALLQVEGAYSLVAIAQDKIIGVRDPLGVRPLVLGRLDEAWVLASETCAFDIIGAEYVREVEPGEVVVLDKTGLHSIKPFLKSRQQRFCIFEFIYFARPDSIMEGTSVYEARKRIGAELARESPVPADVVIPVPDSGVPAAIGYAAEANIPFELGIIRNHYVGRTFIEPSDHIRHLGVKLKHNANRAKIQGKRIILVDDSIVRGTTSKKIVEMVRSAGATEVHMRISSPPTTHSCFYGIDTPQREKLLAYQYDVDGMARFIGADSLAFVSIAGLYRAMGAPSRDPQQPQFCDACFTGDYPTPLTDADGGSAGRQLSLLEIA
ncbi:MAG TPA: amidophosphoribosyltransferase [Alphaproteobacteria bacterium]|nr:amidophosphoribosyltransferase [Alphaproteobacteria bacterium]